jgi:ribosomal protein L37AE/L43A
MSSKFKYGDRVIAGFHPGKIVSVRKEVGRYKYMVRFDEKLIPPEMEYEEGRLVFENSNEEVCPICKNRWKIVKFNMKTWKDCEKCGKTSEEIVKSMEEMKDLPSLPGYEYEDDLTEQLEAILNGGGIDLDVF